MPRPLTERELRRRRHRRRKRIVLSIFFLLLVLIVILIVSLTQLTVGLVQDCIWYQPKETPTGTTTTTYPTLDYASVDSVLNMYSAILYDATHDKILFEKNPNDVVYPASLTKMLTAIVACEFCPDNTTFTIGDEQELVAWDASTAYLQPDTPYTKEEVLQALLLPSGADAAYCIAANVAKVHENNMQMDSQQAIDTFIGYMNSYAVEIGCTNSHFVTPDGYHDPDHHTTASDMLIIARKAVSYPLIKKIVATHQVGEWINGNLLLDPEDAGYYPYANGIKTGYTDEAGFNLAASATRNGVELYAILIGSTSPEYRFFNASTLFEMGFNLAENPPTTTTAFHDYFDYFTVSTKKAK
ncbi:MAG: D-alanyl-D-alanine carboxypeptidase [Clostridia bacterium]|nr:D-alanyl-D-alanine carboxypeptidase [Clostridia bacterium]